MQHIIELIYIDIWFKHWHQELMYPLTKKNCKSWCALWQRKTAETPWQGTLNYRQPPRLGLTRLAHHMWLLQHVTPWVRTCSGSCVIQQRLHTIHWPSEQGCISAVVIYLWSGGVNGHLRGMWPLSSKYRLVIAKDVSVMQVTEIFFCCNNHSDQVLSCFKMDLKFVM